MDIVALKQRVNNNIETLCGTLLPNGKKKGSEWKVGSLEGEEGASLSVHLTGEKTGVWCDFATGDSGDAIDLICKMRGIQMGEAIDWLHDYLGVSEPRKIQPRASYKPPRKPSDMRRPAKTETQLSPVFDYLIMERKLSERALEKFRIGEVQRNVELDGKDTPTPVTLLPYFTVDGALATIKYLALKRTANGKKKMWTDSGTRPTLFGWHALDPKARAVVICEGEINAMSWDHYGIPALATPFGAGHGAKHEWIAAEWDNLDRFETIYLNFDPDEAGQAAIKDLPDRLGRHRVKIVPPLPHKDANDCLREGVTLPVMQGLLDNARHCDPPQLRSVMEFRNELHRAFYPNPEDHQGWALPFEGAGKFRLRRGELSVWSGFNGSGKTQLLNQRVLWLATQNVRSVLASLEMKPVNILHRIVRQATGQKVPESEYIDAVVDYLSDRVWIYDQQGAVNASNVTNIFEYSQRRYDCQVLVVDSLMKLGLGFDDHNGQKLLVEKLHTFALQKDVHVALVAHSRKGLNDHSPPGKMDVSGAGSITDMADSLLIAFRNTKKQKALAAHYRGIPYGGDLDKLKAEPDGRLICEKERNGDGEVFELPLWYDYQSMQFRDQQPVVVRPIFPFGNREIQREVEYEVEW